MNGPKRTESTLRFMIQAKNIAKLATIPVTKAQTQTSIKLEPPPPQAIPVVSSDPSHFCDERKKQPP